MLRLSQALGNVTVVQKGEQDVISDGEQGEWVQTPPRMSASWHSHAGHQPQEDHLSAASGGLGLCQLAQLFQLRENSEEAAAWKSGTHSLGSAFFFFSLFGVFVELFNMQFVSFCRELLSEPVT